MTKNKIIQILFYSLILLAVIAIIGLVAKFTGGFTSDFKTFYVTVNNKDVLSKSGGYSVSVKQPLEVDVKYTFGFTSDEVKGYSVKIVPNKVSGKDFTFSTGDEDISFQSIKDLSAGFSIKKGEKSFTVTPKADTLTEVMRSIYPELSDNLEQKGYEDMFSLIVTSYNGEASVTLNFVISGTVAGVNLDKEAIEF